MSSLPPHIIGAAMADLRMNRRIEEPSGDREALEHIARALEGRTIPGPAQGVSRKHRGVELALTPQSLNILL